MKFEKIIEESKVYPGEYLLHEPSRQIVLCGAFNYDEDFIRCLLNGNLITDKVENFKKIVMSRKERKQNNSKRCKGCS
tara:strand:+ start:5 stop:238 length:234 start_codon:yes stop_codon:yes gene_type:complete